ncbi:hypothetical protein Bca4012_100007 [Brassica carinata]
MGVLSLDLSISVPLLFYRRKPEKNQGSIFSSSLDRGINPKKNSTSFTKRVDSTSHLVGSRLEPKRISNRNRI